MGYVVAAVLGIWALGYFSRKYGANHPANVYPAVVASQAASIPPALSPAPMAPPINLAVQAAASPDSVVSVPPHIINSTTGQDLTALALTDSVPPIGQQPANFSAWINVFDSPGVYKWNLISDPTVSFLADISGHRVQ